MQSLKAQLARARAAATEEIAQAASLLQAEARRLLLLRGPGLCPGSKRSSRESGAPGSRFEAECTGSHLLDTDAQHLLSKLSRCIGEGSEEKRMRAVLESVSRRYSSSGGSEA